MLCYVVAHLITYTLVNTNRLVRERRANTRKTADVRMRSRRAKPHPNKNTLWYTTPRGVVLVWQALTADLVAVNS